MTQENLPISDCKINEYFIDSNERAYHIKEYCKKNCQYKCLNGLNYKKREVTK